MDDFPGLLARDFGYKPQGKSAPMAPPRTTTTTSSSSSSHGIGSGVRSSNSYTSAKSAPIFDDHDRAGDDLLFSDVFGGGGGPPKYSDQPPRSAAASSSFDYDAIFKEQNAKSSSLPVYDKPVYDEDIFDGLPGIKSASTSAATASPASAKFNDVFTSSASSPKRRDAFDDLFSDLRKKEPKEPAEKDASPAFDDLLPGFGRSSSPGVSRSTSESRRPQKPSSDLGRTASGAMDNPFASLNSTSKTQTSSSGFFTDPLEEISKFSSTGSAKVDNVYGGKGILDDLDPLENLGRHIPPVSTEISKEGKDRSHLHSASFDDTYSPASKETFDQYPVASPEGHSQRKVLVDDFPGPSEPMFDIPATSESHRSAGRAASSPSHVNAGANDANFVPGSENVSEAYDDIWLTVSEVPLFTQPTTAPPPSRPPPPRPPRVNKPRTSAFSPPNSRRKVHDHSSLSNSHSPLSARAERTSVMDELDDFATGGPRATSNEHADVFYEDVDTSSAAASAAAMKEAMDKAEAKFRQMREREYLKTARSKDAGVADQDIQDTQQRESRERQERMDHEQQQREREEEEIEQRRLEKEREREDKEREQRRLERERERAREAERARENGRHAVERATREARERAAIEARVRAERATAEKVTAEARQRAERAAVQRAQAEARERAAANARERAEKAAAEARERANAEAREKEAAERSAALKAEADARTRAERAAVERAAAEARQRAAAAARANQQRNENPQNNENDLESFFSSRASSAPRPRATPSQDPFFDTRSKGGPETPGRTPVGSTTNMRKASSATNIVDDLSSIFGAAAASGEFQEVEGETEDRRRARMERQHRTQERAAKALAEKNQRDLQVQREQAERDRIGETLDVEIKRWAAGKEGNLRALLSTMQYVLWPECGWQPVSLTDLIVGASVKKAYRKATLCIHPDKVQQKGATLQQKYIAEKVFDLLKEAWNKFNSEELF